MIARHKITCLLIVLCLCVALVGCEKPSQPETTPSETVINVQDFAGSLKLNMDSSTKKQEVTVKNYVDGDTVHFHVPESVMAGGVLKARFLAINTPESTGKIEEYGKAASRFTREKLSAATSIIIESDNDKWNADSTGGRYLVWVWYKTADMTDYRNLNIEILQNGLAIASNSSNNIYGDVAMAAISQARAQKLNIYSGEKDPDFYYGSAVELDLKELRLHTEQYSGQKVAFNGIVSSDHSNTVYVESYDSETDMYYGISVYYGFNLNAFGLEVLKVGNEVRIVGTVQYYETGGTWQISGLSYSPMDPENPNNIQVISQGHSGAFRLTEADTFVRGTVDIVTDEGTSSLPYAQLAMSTSIQMQDLLVTDVYTTTDPESSSQGAMTLTCKAGDVTVTVRTDVLKASDGSIVTADAYLGKTIDVKGIVDYFDGAYQIKVFSEKNIQVKNS